MRTTEPSLTWWFSQAVLALMIEQLSAAHTTPCRRRSVLREPSAQPLCKIRQPVKEAL